MPAIQFDRYYRYDDLTRLLNAYAEEFPQLVSLDSIGKSYEGRDIWLVTVTNTATGPADEKPALWADGNIHASEVSPSSACLHLLHTLTAQYGSDAAITRCLDTRAFYICPRVNPDGAEWALADKPKIIRSSTRPWPYDEEPLGGLVSEDIDGDGRVLMMRIKDPNGPWKQHPTEPRLLIRRDPTEYGGEYYRVLPEGHVENYDGVSIMPQTRKQGLDINRNFPAGWRQENEQPGAGPYPVSEPEVRAIVDFIARHRNICSGVSLHTMSGALLRPFSDHPDDDMPAEDLWAFKRIGAKGTEITGYPNVSVYHDFRYHPRQVITGVFDDWLYAHLGIYGWTIEIWSPQRQAGIEDYKFIEWYRDHPDEDDMKLLRWSDEALEGQGYVDWYAFDHPQLGKVELGGWNEQYAWRNPPPKFLEKEIAPLTEWMIWQCQVSPKLELLEASTTPLGDGSYRVRLAVHNSGWLPSYCTKMALNKRVIRGVVAEIELPEGAALVVGKPREELSQLEGRSLTAPALMPGRAYTPTANTADRAKVEWVIHAPNGGTVKLRAQHDRAGVVRTELALK